MTSRTPRRARGKAASDVPPDDSIAPPQSAPGDDGSELGGAGTSASAHDQLDVGATSTVEHIGSITAQDITGPVPDPDDTGDVLSKPVTSVSDRVTAAVQTLQQKQELDARAAQRQQEGLLTVMQQMLLALTQVTAKVDGLQKGASLASRSVRADSAASQADSVDTQEAAVQRLQEEASARRTARAAEAVAAAQQQLERAQRDMLAAEDEQMALSLSSRGSRRLTAAALDELEHKSEVSAFTFGTTKADKRRAKTAAQQLHKAELQQKAALRKAAEDRALAEAGSLAHAERQAIEQQRAMAKAKAEAEARALLEATVRTERQLQSRAPVSGSEPVLVREAKQLPLMKALTKDESVRLSFPPASVLGDGGTLVGAPKWLAAVMTALTEAIQTKAEHMLENSDLEPTWDYLGVRWVGAAFQALHSRLLTDEKFPTALDNYPQLRRADIVVMLNNLKVEATSMERGGETDLKIMQHIKRSFIEHFIEKSPSEFTFDLMTVQVPEGTMLRTAYTQLQDLVGVAKQMQLEVDGEGILDNQRKLAILRWCNWYYPTIHRDVRSASLKPRATSDHLMEEIRKSMNLNLHAAARTDGAVQGGVVRAVASSGPAQPVKSKSAQSAKATLQAESEAKAAAEVLAFHVSESTICHNCNNRGHMWGECPAPFNSALLNGEHQRNLTESQFAEQQQRVKQARATVARSQSNSRHSSSDRQQYRRRTGGSRQSSN